MTTTTAVTTSTGGRRRWLRAGSSIATRPRGLTGDLIAAAEHGVLAVLAFAPLLAVRPGVVTSDTKTYLYLDPGRFLAQVASMWNPGVGLGTVNHQYIGYLLPMGPFFWLFSAVHVPLWVAQRLWLGGILFVAGAGILYLSRTFGLWGPGRLLAALAYMLSPYFLQYSGRISVILLPWAGLPWMVALAARALRRGGWRHAALFAVVVALVSSINATAIIYVGVAPVLWLVYATAVEREATWRQAGVTALKIGVLSAAVCLWWIEGLAIEAGYGVNVLKFTETVPATSQTSSTSEVLRGLGYWYFYGGDRLGPWTAAAVAYTQWIWLLAASFCVPVLAFLAATFARWRYRGYFILMVVVGVVLSVGAHPYENPTPLGGLLKTFMTDTTAGLALRSTDRATPLVVLGTAVLLGSGVSALWRRLPRIGLVTGLLVAGLVVAANPAVFNGDAVVANGFVQPARLPSYELAAAHHLNATHPGTRVLEIPGNDFNSESWGDTVDTEMPALLNRPFAIHEQQVLGSEATYDTLYAIDEPIQQGIEQWSALAPMARLISAGDVLVQYDAAYDHYGAPQPELVYQQLQQTPPGLSNPVSYGAPLPDVANTSMLNEADLAAPANPAVPSPLMSYTVADPRPIVRAESNTGAVIVAGDATGLEHMAAAGLLNTSSAIYYAGTLDTHPKQLHSLLAGGAALVVTDSNRKEAFRWDTLTANAGYTETATENLTKTDPSDSPIDLFRGAPVGAHTLATYVGAAKVTASSYGNSVSYTPENQPYAAVDGNLDTAWETGVFVPDPVGQWWQIALPHAVTENHVTLVQPLSGDNLSRYITKATLTFDGRDPVTVDLGPSSRTPAGQVVSFPARSFRTLRITIARTNNDHEPAPAASEVGLAEVQIPGVSVSKVIEMPTDLLKAAGTASLSHRLTLVMTRRRIAASTTTRSDPEPSMTRSFTLPTARTFSLSGTASLSALIPDSEINQLLGQPGSNGSGIVAYSKGRLLGDLAGGAGAALDGSSQTVWEPGFGAGNQSGDWLAYDLPRPITFDHLDLEVVADGRHSVPTSITVSTENGSHTVSLPPIADSRVAGATVTVPVSFPALTGAHIRITVDGVRLESTTNFYSSAPVALPLGIAEVGIPGIRMPPYPATVPGTCQSNLLSIDGQPMYVRITGPTSTALSGGELSVQPCGPDAHGITLGAGTHIVQTALGHTLTTGWQVDQLTLDSAPGGGAEPAAPSPTDLPATQPGTAPTVTVTSQNATNLHLSVKGATSPFELVLGESKNTGWQAVATPGPGAKAGAHAVNLGPAELVDSFANGWPVTSSELRALGVAASGGAPGVGAPGAGTSGSADGSAATGTFTVTLRWTPQAVEWATLGISAAALALCLVVGFLPEAWRPWRRRRRQVVPSTGSPAEGWAAPGGDRWSTVPVRSGRLAGDNPPVPVLSSPLSAVGRRPPLWVVAIAAALTGAVAAAIASPLIGAAAAVATAGVLLVRHARAATALVAVGLVAAAAAFVVTGQVQHPVAEGSGWPSAYESAGVLAWMAIVFLGADAVVEKVRRGRAAPPIRTAPWETASSAGQEPGAPTSAPPEDGQALGGPAPDGTTGEGPATGEV